MKGYPLHFAVNQGSCYDLMVATAVKCPSYVTIYAQCLPRRTCHLNFLVHICYLALYQIANIYFNCVAAKQEALQQETTLAV